MNTWLLMCRAWIWSKRVSYHPRTRNGLCVSEHNTKCSKLSKHTNEVISKQCREMVHSGARLPCSMRLFNLMTYSITHNIPESGGFSSCSGWEWVTACSTMQDFFNSEALCNYWNSNLNIFNFTNKITLTFQHDELYARFTMVGYASCLGTNTALQLWKKLKIDKIFNLTCTEFFHKIR